MVGGEKREREGQGKRRVNGAMEERVFDNSRLQVPDVLYHSCVIPKTGPCKRCQVKRC